MTKYVAFLRGINVGGRIVKMAELKACCEGAGLQNVSTVLQTGNVIFESDESELKSVIESALTKTFEYPAKAQIIELDELRQIIKSYPFDSSDENMQHYVIFMENDLEKVLFNEVESLDTQIDSLAEGNGVLYWRVQKGMTLKSVFAKFLTKSKYRLYNTNRNIKTLKKLI